MLEEGNGHKKALHFSSPPRRVVSLVPSLTESLFDLGFGDAVVGITDYCVHPAEKLEDIPRIGGPKNPRVEDIIRLHPDLVLANWEENTRQTVEALEQAGIPVWVTFPKSVRQSLDVLWALASISFITAAYWILQTVAEQVDADDPAPNRHARFGLPAALLLALVAASLWPGAPMDDPATVSSPAAAFLQHRPADSSTPAAWPTPPALPHRTALWSRAK